MQSPGVRLSKYQLAALTTGAYQRKAQLRFIGHTEKLDPGVPASETRVSDAESLLKRTVFAIARDSTGCSSTHKQDTELSASRLRSSGPVGEY